MFSWSTRSVWAALLMLCVLAGWPATASAQVDCRNGNYCPAGNACLKNGLCAVRTEAPPGGPRMSNGVACEPGWRENNMRPGECIPATYVECSNRQMCGPGHTCEADGTGHTCKGPTPTVSCPSGIKCPTGRVCGSTGTYCVNPTFHQDCGDGIVCSKSQACTVDGSYCAWVGTGRTRQVPYRR